MISTDVIVQLILVIVVSIVIVILISLIFLEVLHIIILKCLGDIMKWHIWNSFDVLELLEYLLLNLIQIFLTIFVFYLGDRHMQEVLFFI